MLLHILKITYCELSTKFLKLSSWVMISTDSSLDESRYCSILFDSTSEIVSCLKFFFLKFAASALIVIRSFSPRDFGLGMLN